MANYRKSFSTLETDQKSAIPGKEHLMAENNAGGFSFVIDDWKRLERFLILGTEGGTYYCSERKLTKDSAQAVLRCLKEDGLRTVQTVVEISDEGRAHKNDPALFVLAMASADPVLATRRAALAALPKVARIGTHLFHFAEFVEGFRGWGRALRTAIADWYQDRTVDQLVNQVVKYQSRDGWSHRDLLRLAHPKTDDAVRDAVYRWVVQGMDGVKSETRKVRDANDKSKLVDIVVPSREANLPELIQAFEKMKALGEGDVSEAVKLITEYNLPREAVATHFLNDPKVWEAMLPSMGVTAMIRNLGKMSQVGFLTQGSAAATAIVNRLSDAAHLQKARVHPLQVLAALTTYAGGRGVLGKNSWTTVQKVVDALDDAFYGTFKNVEPSGKSHLLAVDISGSMTCGAVSGIAGLTPNKAAAAMALVIANTEPAFEIVGFSTELKHLAVTPKMRLDAVAQKMQECSFGGTDCAQPMVWAKDKHLEFDVFHVYTDNETWAGRIQPSQALVQYRQKTGIPAKLAVIGMTATNFSIADPTDSGMMDVVGFDTNAPIVLADFARN